MQIRIQKAWKLEKNSEADENFLCSATVRICVKNSKGTHKM